MYNISTFNSTYLIKNGSLKVFNDLEISQNLEIFEFLEYHDRQDDMLLDNSKQCWILSCSKSKYIGIMSKNYLCTYILQFCIRNIFITKGHEKILLDITSI
jgi:hypothetical protein